MCVYLGVTKMNTLQPIADGVAQNLEIFFFCVQFSTRRTKILVGFRISAMSFIT